MATTTIDPKDSAFFYASRPGHSTDHYITTALQHGNGRSTTEDLTAQIRSRVSRVVALRARLSAPALHLDYPSWVHRTAPLDDDVVVHDVPGGTWSRAASVLGSVLASPLDSERSSWRVHVLPELQGVPCSSGSADVVVVQISHCLTDGSGAVALTRFLLGDDASFDEVPAPEIGEPHSRAVAALRGVGRVPGQVVGIVSDVVRSLRSSRDFSRRLAVGTVTARPPARRPTMFNDDPGNDRVAHVVVRSRDAVTTVAGTRVSVTAASLTVVARAMALFLREQGLDVPRDLGAHVTMALPPNASWSGVNRLAAANVDLCPLATGPREQTDGIAASLAAERVRGTHPAVLDAVRVADHLPAPLLRWGIRRSEPDRSTASAHTTVSSVRCGANDLEIADRHSLFMTAFAALSPTDGLNHTVFGLGDTIAFGVLTSAVSVPQHRRYVDILSTVLDELAG
ncbi:DUF1298 domain-containing protein [Rhodococcus sp. BP-349]|uniref:wax ester/triacylglycerol synthase domain-containing protein n=1 Tax=unclassified Rhodococcus (in: high G+C Gram-positive bacteria) TaxID=192944 RepID=UPI001C9A6A71|nr:MULTISPECIES: wax ester/triacylglycerol synthase domain-containing protein [unclassified Rhodococcus (in: high G+C Gram-positive bacteria)]MBY6538444.1 DUF1298 domain-containing protein [Rhodococcus sp. BP-363]MBY6542781.1 DUF1298 domain-containing protein [Rhodococcus sp. BP-369]MBY6562011.1 DUF1298 domain-containing protein [Rhodococcus sp. BP-370]MBY6576303.1 DUF1298 domain-containing protein [Rhodococcus sp. BP-364]MBY6585604.1 DUF1298 domain-containing protein [Rhodococcus sp. BP-358]